MSAIPYNEQHYLTLVEALENHANHQPDKIAFRYLANGEEEVEALSYADLLRASRKVACQLSKQASAGDRAMLFYPQGLDFVVALFACFLSGVIAVPVYPPIGRRRTERMRRVVMDCGPKVALSKANMAYECQKWMLDQELLLNFSWMNTDQAEAEIAFEAPEIFPETIALLQYTSGSTGDPKGVTVTHHNLVHNNHELWKASGHCTDVVCWLPIYHDMGLIGNIIYAVYTGATQTLLSPVDFVRKPIRWLRAISTYKATASGGPNFAYDLCVKYISDEDLQGIDLSHWHATCNGAEPIRHDTIERFTERFAAVGFKKEVFTPCYGMAEATALISGRRDALRTLILDKSALAKGKVRVHSAEGDQRLSQHICSSGPVADGMQVAVVHPEKQELCAPDEIGEIWVRGHSVTQGYWQQPEATKLHFEAKLKNPARPEDAEHKWLRSGDLGFMQQGHVYITGRLKEMIIINGTNIYPQDVEYTIQKDNPMLEQNAGAVFGLDSENGTERVIVFQEIARHAIRNLEASAIFDDILNRVLAQHDINVSGIYLISPGKLPKTTSGKIRRLKCAEAYLNRNIDGLLEAWDTDTSVLERKTN